MSIEFKRLLVLLVFFLLVSGCSSTEEGLDNIPPTVSSEGYIFELESKIEELEEEIVSLNHKIESYEESEYTESEDEFVFYGGLLYLGIESDEAVRFIPDEIELLALPYTGAPPIRLVPENTIVTVRDKVSVNNELELGNEWYCVSIDVYDTPMDYVGWIRVIETSDFDESTLLIYEGNVDVEIGSKVIESFAFPKDESVSNTYITEYEKSGKIEERTDGFVRLFCAGGETVWVSVEDIIYPELP